MVVLPLLVLALAAASCLSDASFTPPTTTMNPGGPGQAGVLPNLDAPTVVINITLTDEGFEPSTVFIPAGRHIRMVLRNRGFSEHHFRIPGLVPVSMTWFQPSELDEYDIETMTKEELASYGITDDDMDNLEHVLHHLTPQFLPAKPESPSGITPLFGEVHGYASAGDVEIMSFFASNTGTFVSEDVLFPEITGRVVVFEEQP